MKISENFDLEEFEASPTAKRYGIDNRILDATVMANIRALVDEVLQPLRMVWGKPLKVNSGYRCASLNRLIPGSSITSQHMTGEAADIATDNPYKLAKTAKQLNLPYDQMILYPTFVHFSHSRKKNRRRILYNKSYQGVKF